MLNRLKKSKSEGFTIIEVMIVLAIAGLILLIVFLAVPALQRNTRNTQRKNDASRLGAAASNYVSNQNGSLPGVTAPAGSTTAAQAILNDAGSLAQYSGLIAGSHAVLTSGEFNIESGALTAPTSLTNGQDGVILSEQAQCDNSNPGQTVGGTAKQMALIYTLEAGSGAPNEACENL